MITPLDDNDNLTESATMTTKKTPVPAEPRDHVYRALVAAGISPSLALRSLRTSNAAAFRAAVVELLRSGIERGRSMGQICEEVGVPEVTLRSWRRQDAVLRKGMVRGCPTKWRSGRKPSANASR